MRKISRENMIKFLDEVRRAVEKEINLSEYSEKISSEEQNELDIYCEGVSNGFLAETFEAITGYKAEVIGEVEKLYTCPCCGLRTLTELYDSKEGTGYDICRYCNWEDDGTSDINVERSINKGSIKDYRNHINANFNKYYINKWLIGSH